MSVNRNRTFLNKSECNHDYRIRWLSELYPRYWDEGTHFYPEYRPGFKNAGKYLQMYKVRMYKTWKYNRKTKWK